MTWIRSAAEEQRAEAAVTLAWAYRYISDPADIYGDLELCVAALLDDPSPAVRRTLAQAIGGIANAPRHIVIALADDRPDIAAVVLGETPVLTEMELAQYALAGEECVQLAIARRSDLSPVVAACLAEKAGTAVVTALVMNLQTNLPGAVLCFVAERFRDDRLIRKALLARTDLPAVVRCDLIEAAATASAAVLAGSDLSPARIERMIRTTTERCVIGAVSRSGAVEVRDLVRHLRAKGRLTIALLLRALASGEMIFFEIAASELSGLDEARVAGLVRDPKGPGFGALVRRAGFPRYCLALFRLALLILDENGVRREGRVLRSVVVRLIDLCAAEIAPGADEVLAALRRLEKEAALDEARHFAMSAPSGCIEAPEEAPICNRLEAPRPMKLLEQLNLIDASPAPLAMAC